MATFRPYTPEELRAAAEAYGIDPDFVEAVYAAESSRGTNPKAMTARPVKRKRDTTIVRGPFQLEDGTASDLIRENRLGNVDVNDPDVHLDLALRLMQKLHKMYNGDYNKMAQAYLAGPGGVGKNVADELGTTPAAYSNRILAEMSALKGGRGGELPTPDLSAYTADNMDRMLLPEILSPFQHGASVPDDMFGIPAQASAPLRGPGTSWRDMLAANMGPSGSNEFSLPPTLSTEFPQQALDADVLSYVQRLVDEELSGKDFAHA